MFNRCRSVLELNVKNFNTSKVTNMSSMFYECQVVKKLNVEKWNTSNVTDMSGMFGWCYQLTNLDVSGFETDNVTNMSGMFNTCNSLKNLNMSNKFKINDGTNFDNMFNKFGIIKIKAKQDIADKLLNKFDSFTIENFEISE
jgi:surface protein